MKECMDSENLHRRLKKINGQVNAIDRMIDEDIPCEQILMQVNAVKSAFMSNSVIRPSAHSLNIGTPQSNTATQAI